MNTARKVGLAVIAFAVAVGIGLAIGSVPESPERRPCGHFYSVQDRLKWLPIPRASHCCTSGRLVSDLKSVGLAQEIYRDAHGRFALTIDELEKELGSSLRISQPYQFQSDRTNWSVVVPQVQSLAGNYLLDTSGEIFFNEFRIPTTNDLMLKSRFPPRDAKL